MTMENNIEKLNLAYFQMLDSPFDQQNWENLQALISALKDRSIKFIPDLSSDSVPDLSSPIPDSELYLRLRDFKLAALEIQAFDLAAILHDYENSPNCKDGLYPVAEIFSVQNPKSEFKFNQDESLVFYLPQSPILAYFLNNLVLGKLPDFRMMFRYLELKKE
jgi:hypothetical protein